MKIKRQIKVPIDDQKRLENAKKLETLEGEIEQIKDDLLLYRKECNVKREAKELEYNALHKSVSSGCEPVDVECEEQIDLDSLTKKVVRCDTEEVLEKRDLTPIEIGREKKRLEKPDVKKE